MPRSGGGRTTSETSGVLAAFGILLLIAGVLFGIKLNVPGFSHAVTAFQVVIEQTCDFMWAYSTFSIYGLLILGIILIVVVHRIKT